MCSYNRLGFSKPHFDALSKISGQVFSEIGSFKDIHNTAAERSVSISPWEKSPIKTLIEYIESLEETCIQGLYAIECLKGFTIHEPSNITEFYVAYYTNDFIARVKTGTDLLALILKHTYDLEISDKRCSLENGAFVNCLRKGESTFQNIGALSNIISSSHSKWLSTFDEVRDQIVHRGGFKYSISGIDQFPVHIQVPLQLPVNQPYYFNADDLKRSMGPYIGDEPLSKFLININSKSFSYSGTAVNPVLLYMEIWKLWSTLTEDILNNCKDDLLSKLSQY